MAHRELTLLALPGRAAAACGETSQTIVLRGHPQPSRRYGHRGHPAIVLSSRDGGWILLANVAAGAPGRPTRMGIVDSASHRFSNNIGGVDRSLTEALAWLAARTPRQTGIRR